jgi:hypothetical protein
VREPQNVEEPLRLNVGLRAQQLYEVAADDAAAGQIVAYLHYAPDRLLRPATRFLKQDVALLKLA